MTKIQAIEKQWKEGYLEGWNEQGLFQTNAPPIPPLPPIPETIEDQEKEKWARQEGKERGVNDRLMKQAGIGEK